MQVGSLTVLPISCTLPGVVTGHVLQRYQHKLPCCLTLRSSELDEVLVVNKPAEQVPTKAGTDGRQHIAISASTTQSLESNAGVTFPPLSAWQCLLIELPQKAAQVPFTHGQLAEAHRPHLK